MSIDTVSQDVSEDDEHLLIPVDMKNFNKMKFDELKFNVVNAEDEQKIMGHLAEGHLPKINGQSWWADSRKTIGEGDDKKMQICSCEVSLDFKNEKIPLKYASIYWPVSDLFVGLDGYEVNLNDAKKDPLCEECIKIYDNIDMDEEKKDIMREANKVVNQSFPSSDGDDNVIIKPLKWKLYGDVPITIRPETLITLRSDDFLNKKGFILELTAPANSISNFTQTGLWQSSISPNDVEISQLLIGPVTQIDLPTNLNDVQPIEASFGSIAKILSKGVTTIFRRGGKKLSSTGLKKGISSTVKKGKSVVSKATKSGVAKKAKDVGRKVVKSKVTKSVGSAGATIAGGVATTVLTTGAAAVATKVLSPTSKEEEPTSDVEEGFEEPTESESESESKAGSENESEPETEETPSE